MKISGYIWWWLDDDKGALLFDLTISCEFGLEKSFLLPPRVPSRFDSGRVISLVLRIIERFNDYISYC